MTQIQGEATTRNQPLSILSNSFLFVDDNSMNRIILSCYISKLGYQATLVENGRQALNKLQSETFDLMLLDVQQQGLRIYQALVTEITRA